MATSERASDDTGSEPSGDGTRHHGRARAISSAVLIVIGCVLAPLTVLTVWAKTTMLDTDQYVSTVAPLATNQDIREAIATRVTRRVMAAGPLVEELKGKLPPRIAADASAARPAIEQRVHAIVLKIVSSSQFAEVWKKANERVQPQVVAALTGNTGRLHLASDGTVELNLADVAHRVRTALAARGVDVNRVPAGQVNTTVELFKWPWLGFVQDAIDALQTIAWLLVALTIVCLGSGIALARRRWRCVLWTAVGVVTGMALILVALQAGRSPYLDLFSYPEGRQAGGAAYDQVLHGLRTACVVVLVLAVVAAVGAWFMGRRRGASAEASSEGPSSSTPTEVRPSADVT